MNDHEYEDDDALTPEEEMAQAVRHEYVQMLKALGTPESTHAIMHVLFSAPDDPRVDAALRAALEDQA